MEDLKAKLESIGAKVLGQGMEAGEEVLFVDFDGQGAEPYTRKAIEEYLSSRATGRVING